MNKATKAVLFTLAIFAIIFLIASNPITSTAVIVASTKAVAITGGFAGVAKVAPLVAALL